VAAFRLLINRQALPSRGLIWALIRMLTRNSRDGMMLALRICEAWIYLDRQCDAWRLTRQRLLDTVDVTLSCWLAANWRT
jgi:hypothetical protein